MDIGVKGEGQWVIKVIKGKEKRKEKKRKKKGKKDKGKRERGRKGW